MDDEYHDDDAALCFPPVARPDARLLILGSLPGARSLELSQYYGHARNHFWPLVGELTGADLHALPYEARLDRLVAHRIALWDVVAQAVRPGSLDQHLRAVRANRLGDFVATLPALEAIAFNGTTASRIGRKQLEVERDARFAGNTASGAVALIDLPSTSPANTMAYSRKQQLWEQLRVYIG